MSEYPHAEKYITKEALENADEQTKQMWEFEAELCERVVEAFGQTENSFPTCPKCGSQVFKIGGTHVDFRVPFVHSQRIQVGNLTILMDSSTVKCAVCGLTKKKRSAR